MRARIFLSLVMLAPGAVWLAGQNPAVLSPAPPAAAAPTPQQQAPYAISKNVREVPIVFTALDKDNRFVAGLTADQIQVYDDNHLQKIRRFDPQSNLPLRIALVLDISNSIATRWDFEQHAALDFLQSVLVPRRDQAMVVAFDTQVRVLQDFTDNFEKLQEAVHAEKPSGGTAFNDAVFLTAHEKLQPDPNQLVRNVMVVVSDGADNQSRYSESEALEEAQRVGAVVYTIGTEPTGSDAHADGVLKKLAQQTGGSAYFPIAARDMGADFLKITNELRNQYLVSYAPDNFIPNGAYHKVEIRILKKGIVIRARQGYYATPTPEVK